MGSEAMWLVMENKIPGKRSRDMGLFGLQERRLRAEINGLQAYESHIGNRPVAILFEHECEALLVKVAIEIIWNGNNKNQKVFVLKVFVCFFN